MPDVIVALYADTASAEKVRTDLFRAGFAADRVDVSSSRAPGPAAVMPVNAGETHFRAYFRSLLAKSTFSAEANDIADRVAAGDAAVIVHPRGRVEVDDADKILDHFAPRLVRRDVSNALSPTPVIGEHAAGKH